MQSELSDNGKTAVESEEEEEDEEEEEAVPRRGRSTRSSFGLRVAFQFPTKKLAKTPNKSSSHLVDSKTDLRREKGCRQAKEREDSASESDDDSRTESQNSDALLKRAMNIKENKAMVSARRALHHRQLPHRCSREGRCTVGCFGVNDELWEWKDSRNTYGRSKDAAPQG